VWEPTPFAAGKWNCNTSPSAPARRPAKRSASSGTASWLQLQMGLDLRLVHGPCGRVRAIRWPGRFIGRPRHDPSRHFSDSQVDNLDDFGRCVRFAFRRNRNRHPQKKYEESPEPLVTSSSKFGLETRSPWVPLATTRDQGPLLHLFPRIGALLRGLRLRISCSRQQQLCAAVQMHVLTIRRNQ
jgi:hypothetical protein